MALIPWEPFRALRRRDDVFDPSPDYWEPDFKRRRRP
jgi:hypothetical protein